MSLWISPQACAWASPSQMLRASSSLRVSDMPSAVVHALIEVAPFEVLHRQVRRAVLLAQVVDRDDVPVRELRGGPGLPEEPFAMVGVVVELAGDDLDGDDTGQQGIEGLVDRPHAALAELLRDFVATDAIQDTLTAGIRRSVPLSLV